MDFVTPDGEPTDSSWFSNVGDSAPEPDDGVPDLEDDAVSTSNPDGSPTDPSWLDDVDDSAPTPPDDGPAVIGIVRNNNNDGLLAGLGVGALGLLAWVVGGSDA